jgi:hypothetical protein
MRELPVKNKTQMMLRNPAGVNNRFILRLAPGSILAIYMSIYISIIHCYRYLYRYLYLVVIYRLEVPRRPQGVSFPVSR